MLAVGNSAAPDYSYPYYFFHKLTSVKSYHNYIILYLKFNSSKRFNFKAAPRDEITPDFLGIFYNSLRCQKKQSRKPAAGFMPSVCSF